MGGGTELAGGAEVAGVLPLDGTEVNGPVVEADVDGVRLGVDEALVVAGVDAGGVDVGAVRAGAGAVVSVLVPAPAVVAGVGGRTFR